MGSVPPPLIPGKVGPLVSTSVDGRAMRDRDALVVLYCVTGGMNWRSNRNWLAEIPVGQWHGVTTDRAGRVTGLDLEENNLRGVIPPEIGNLGSLEQVFLDDNQLTGPIPPGTRALCPPRLPGAQRQPTDRRHPAATRQSGQS